MATDAELIGWSLAGDGESFVAMIARHEAAVGAYLYRRVGQAVAEELLAEVWIAAFGSLGTYDATYDDARPWLFGVARNTLRRHWRNQRPEDLVEDPGDLAPGFDPWPGVDDRVDGAAVLRNALAHLRPNQREVLTLVVWEELSIADAARTLGIPAGTARNALHQARMSLRNQPALIALLNQFNYIEGVQVTIDEMDLVGVLIEVEPLRAEAYDQARAALRTAIAEVQRTPLVAAQSARSDTPRSRARVTRGLVGAGIAAVAAAVVLFAVSGTDPALTSHAPTGNAPAAVGKVNGQLMHLAADITADPTPPGDATLVLRTQSYPDSPSITGADLYTDSGEYFYATTESGLPSAIASNADVGGGVGAREVAAALYAVNGNLDTAREMMANAPFPGGVQPSLQTQLAQAQAAEPALKAKGINLPEPTAASIAAHQKSSTDNYIWMDSMDAFAAGAGNPQVRAGVLRILSTLPEVTVINTTSTNGQPVLTVTATAPALPANYQEALTINATSGVPVSFAGGTPGQTPSVTVVYAVSRVTMSDMAAGDFAPRIYTSVLIAVEPVRYERSAGEVGQVELSPIRAAT